MVAILTLVDQTQLPNFPHFRLPDIVCRRDISGRYENQVLPFVGIAAAWSILDEADLAN